MPSQPLPSGEEPPADEVLIGGVWTRGSGHANEVTDPATGRVLTTLHTASPKDVDTAARAGARAAADPAWRDLA
ncbi:aldehyde dehydrogenase, partial [Streptomyces albidoflavus]